MIRLYEGSGSSEFSVLDPVLDDQRWWKLKLLAVDFLRKKGHEKAAGILETQNFNLYEGSNGFGDDFRVLFGKVNLDEYITLGNDTQDYAGKAPYSEIAYAVTELGFFIRFIAVEIDHNSSPQPVATPKPKITSSVVEAALNDAQQMVSQNRPVSAVDRAHTALHGYLYQICTDANLTVQSDDPSLTESVKILIKQHPKFANHGPQKDQIEKVFKGMSAICDALNPIRNHGSLAHANENLLEPAEAMLAINASRTLLHYVDQKLQ
jgi:hypothetical protein